MARYTKHFEQLPASVQKFIRYAVEHLHPDEVILFGSRARGSHRPNSDFDLALKKMAFNEALWTKTLVELESEPFTLHKIDLVRLDQLDESYQRNIKNEGLQIYG